MTCRITLVVAALSVALVGWVVEADLNEGLVGSWNFNEGDGDTAHDSSPRANHGTVNGSTRATGICDSALGFDGQDDYVDVFNDVGFSSLGSRAYGFLPAPLSAVAGDLLAVQWEGWDPGSAVLRFDEVTGEFLGEFVTLGSGNLGDAGSPTFGPDGNLYVRNDLGSLGPGGVWRYDGANGDFIDAFVPATIGSGINGITFGPDGDLYATVWSDGSVRRFDGTTGEPLGSFVSPHSGGLDAPAGLQFGPDGNLYVASLFADEVFRYNGYTGAFMGVFTEQGYLDRANQLRFGPDGKLYVSSTAGGQVLRFDGMTGSLIDVFIDDINWPIHIGFGPDGHFYVTDNEPGGAIDRYHGETGEFIDHFIPEGDGGLTYVTGFVWIPDGGPFCGDGVVDDGEECDDGNAQSGDGCDANCNVEPDVIPTVSEWGLMVMALLLLTGIKIKFGGRGPAKVYPPSQQPTLRGRS